MKKIGSIFSLKWQGSAGQGVVTAADTLAQILAHEGKYVQSLPEFGVGRRGTPVTVGNRVSDNPIRNHSLVADSEADIVVVLNSKILLFTDVVRNAGKDAVFIVNSAYDPDFIKGKVDWNDRNGNNGSHPIYTLDADTISREEAGSAIPNIPMLTVVLCGLKLVPVDKYRQLLKETLSLKWSPAMVEAGIKTVDRSIDEVKGI